jgi:type VI secretion system protein ImpD/type VI secretion system protein ImpC
MRAIPTVVADTAQTALLDKVSGGGLETFLAAALADGTAEAMRLALDRTIAAIDALVAAQLDAILHHDRLRRLEGSWRGLAWLVAGQDPGGRVLIKVLNLAWRDLCRDLARATEFDQSQIFRKVYEQEFGMAGGAPFGLLVVDHEVRHRPAAETPTDDVSALTALAGVAAAAFAPVVLAASPALLQVDDFADLASAGELADPFRSEEFARWRGLARQDDMRFVAVALPRVLARARWADDPARVDGFRYAEQASGAGERVWMTAGFAFAAVVAQAFTSHAWPADVRGAETDRLGGGVVTRIPNEPFPSAPSFYRASLDVALSDRQERTLSEAGLMPLSALPFGQQAVFASVRSLHVPARFAGPHEAVVNANARFSKQINSMLCVSRFAHYIKLMAREAVGSFHSADEIEQRLHVWLQSYVNSNLSSSGDARARFPLVAANVTVREKPGQPGHFVCTAHLQPHFQLDDVAATFRLVTDIAAPAK